MRREFTQNELDKLLAYVKADKDKNAGRILGDTIDFFADWRHYSGLDIEDYVNDIDTYHQKVVDAQNFTEDEIKTIFTNVMQADSDSSNFRKEGIYSLLSTVEKLTSVIRIDDANPDSVPLFMTGEDYKSFSELLVECDMDDPVLGLTEDEKKKFVELYEKLNPEHAANMEGIVNIFEEDGYDGYEEDLLNIKLLAYSADEPYRSAYLNNIGNVRYGDVHNAGREYSSMGAFYVNFENNGEERNSLSYKTFFHETTHCIDYYLGEEGKKYTTIYQSSTDGLTFNKVLENEVRNRIDSTIAEYFEQNGNFSQEQQNEIKDYVIDAIMNQVDHYEFGDPNFSKIVDKDAGVTDEQVELCYSQVVNDINSELHGTVVDYYGGFTGNTLKSASGDGWMHNAVEKNSIGEYYLYWVNGEVDDSGKDVSIILDGGEEIEGVMDTTDSVQDSDSDFDEKIIMSNQNVKYTNHAESEFFANSMASNICRNEEDVFAYAYCSSETNEFYNSMLESIQ